MSHADDMRKGDIGTAIRMTVKRLSDQTAFDVSGATLLEIDAVKPSGATVTWTAVLTPGSADSNQFEFVTTATTDIDELGRWRRQGYFEIGGSPRLRTSWFEWDVGPVT